MYTFTICRTSYSMNVEIKIRCTLNVKSTRMVRYWYVVFLGHQLGIYQTGLEFEEQITDIFKPKFRKFESFEEASFHFLKFLHTGIIPPRISQHGSRHGDFRDEGSSSTQPLLKIGWHRLLIIPNNTHHWLHLILLCLCM